MSNNNDGNFKITDLTFGQPPVPSSAATMSNNDGSFKITDLTSASLGKDVCTHPGSICGLCIRRCGQKLDGDKYGVSLDYIHKNLRLTNEEMACLQDKDSKDLLNHKKLYFNNKKLYLILGLDHMLLDSTCLADITEEERYLNVPKDDLPDSLKNSLHRLDFMHMMTKLRPFVHSFLREASKLFGMYICTRRDRACGLEMARLLDPQDIYFNTRVIARGNPKKRYRKPLDVVVGRESAVLILDDTKAEWGEHKENVIVMERYLFFSSSFRKFGLRRKSLSELRSDESETDGALASVLRVLQQIHTSFFDTEHGESLVNQDVRQLLRNANKEVLRGCTVIFSDVFPAEEHGLWKLAEELGASCCTELDSAVTHVVSVDAGTEKSQWAVQEGKLLVDPEWIEAANYFWRRMPEADYPVCVI